MSADAISRLVRHHPEALRTDDSIEHAVRRLLEDGLPALPVGDEHGRYAGIFGEREFLTALFPGYLRELHGAAFVSPSLEEALQKREACRHEPVGRYMTTDHVEVGPDVTDTQLAEIFFHHRVLVVPVVVDNHVDGVITRSDFFRALVERFVDRSLA